MNKPYIHKVSARKDIRTYFAILICGGMSYAYFLNPPTNQTCDGAPCPEWFHFLITLFMGLALLVFFSSIANLIKNPDRGSEINSEKKTISWWTSYAAITILPADKLTKIVIDQGLGDKKLYFVDKDEKKIPIPEDCIPWPCENWCNRVKETFPHIQIEEKK